MNTSRATDAAPFRLGRLAHVPGGMFDLLLTSLFINILSLAMPLSLLQIYDRILPNNAQSTLFMLISGVAVALILEAVLRMGRSYVTGWMGARFEYAAGTQALERLLSAGIVDYERQGSGVHLERMNSLGTLKEFYAGQAILVLCDLPFAVLYLFAVWYLAGWLVLAPIGLMVLFVSSAMVTAWRLHKALDARMMADDRRFNFIIEVLGGIHTLKSMAMENQMLRRYERLQETCAGAEHKVAFNSSTALSIGALFSQISVFAVVGLGSTLVIDGVLTIGGLVACTMLSGRAMQPMQRAVGIWTRFQTIRLARKRLQEIFKLKPETTLDMPTIPAMKGSVELRGVSYFYGKNKDGEDLPEILKGVDIKIEAGEAIGIRGGNASGKSTLLALMIGALRPTKGQVLVDGTDITGINPVSLRSQMAYLPQKGELFSGTILENITMFRPEREEAAKEAARIIGVDSVVAHMPLGYDTRVGEGAQDALSQGVKQRVAIARGLASRPPVLLFDEANTAMDSIGDAVLRSALKKLKGHCTLILVTRRPSLLKLSDRIYDLKDGRVTLFDSEASSSPPSSPPPPEPEPEKKAAPKPKPKLKPKLKLKLKPKPKPKPKSPRVINPHMSHPGPEGKKAEGKSPIINAGPAKKTAGSDSGDRAKGPLPVNPHMTRPPKPKAGEPERGAPA